MKKFFTLSCIFYTVLSFGQMCINNPSIQQEKIIPTLLIAGGEGVLEFSFFENLLDYTDEENDPIELEICLFDVVPKNVGNGVVTGSFSGAFTWSYDPITNCITGVQNTDILGGTGGLIQVYFYVIGAESCSPPIAGFQAVLKPAACMSGVNETIDDTASSFKCIEPACLEDVCALLDLGNGEYDQNMPLAYFDCDNGGTNNISECYQGTNPNASSDDCLIGTINGCDNVCVSSGSTQVKKYLTDFNGLVTWKILPEYLNTNNVAVLSLGANAALDFTGYSLNQPIQLVAKGTTNCGTEIRSIQINMNQDCVWAGDVNNDYQPGNRFENWVKDVLLYGFALDHVQQIPTNDTLISASRAPACMGGTPTEWGPQSCLDWQLKTGTDTIPANVLYLDSIGNLDSINLKYADCNGDGTLAFAKNWNNLQDSFATVNNPSDHDVLFFQALNNPQQSGGNKSNKNNPLFNILTLDSVYTNGSFVNFNISMGDLLNQIPDVKQVAFVVEATLGIDPLPFMLLNNSHLTTNPNNMITYADFPNGYTNSLGDSLHYYVVINNPGQPVDFKGEQVCNLVCVATVAGLLGQGGSQGGNKNPVDSIPLHLKITTAGISTPTSENIVSTSEEHTIHVLLDPLLNAKILLQGCTDPSTLQMRDDLRAQSLISFVEPYSLDTNNVYPMPELKGIRLADTSQLLNLTGPNAIVDWVFVEIRDAVDPSILVWSRATFVNRQGYLVDLDGVSPLQLSRLPRGSYHILIRHRTHLPVITSTPVYLDRSGNLLNFSTGQNASNQALIAPGVYGLIPGDSNADQVINAQDRSLLWNQRNAAGYFPCDVNMDGVVNAADRSIVWNNRNSVFTLQ